MEALLYTLFFLMLWVALLYPALAIFGYDVYAKKNRNLKTIIRWRNRGVDIWQSHLLYSILQMVAPLIPVSPAQERRMNDNLVRADIPYTAKEYYAKAFISALLGVFLGIIGAVMDSAILIIAGVLLAIFLYFKNYDQVKDALKGKFELIENETPQFIRSVESGLHTDRDVINVIKQYNKIASPAMRSELEILIGDMQTSSVQQGLMRFDNRMNSPEISRLCAALIEVDRGVDASLILQSLAVDMGVMHHQIIQRELDKRPGKMKRAILPGGIILVIMMLYILVQAVISSASSLM